MDPGPRQGQAAGDGDAADRNHDPVLPKDGPESFGYDHLDSVRAQLEYIVAWQTPFGVGSDVEAQAFTEANEGASPPAGQDPAALGRVAGARMGTTASYPLLDDRRPSSSGNADVQGAKRRSRAERLQKVAQYTPETTLRIIETLLLRARAAEARVVTLESQLYADRTQATLLGKRFGQLPHESFPAFVARLGMIARSVIGTRQQGRPERRSTARAASGTIAADPPPDLPTEPSSAERGRS